MRRETRRVLAIGALAVAVIALVAIVLTVDPGAATRTDLASRLAGPGAAGWLGHDGLGRDVLARLALGARVSFGVAATVVTISLVVGVALGATAALAGGWTD